MHDTDLVAGMRAIIAEQDRKTREAAAELQRRAELYPDLLEALVEATRSLSAAIAKANTSINEGTR